MDNAPHDFILNHKASDRKAFLDFKHRTFQPTDTLYFLEYLQEYYKKNHSLEDAFSQHLRINDEHIGPALIGFRESFFNHPYAPHRTKKHIATPVKGSTCKRLAMFLRWMVRKDDAGVDFGLWHKISMHQLVIPLDVHVFRLSSALALTQRRTPDLKTALEITKKLQEFDPIDPIKYDFAIAHLGISGARKGYRILDICQQCPLNQLCSLA